MTPDKSCVANFKWFQQSLPTYIIITGDEYRDDTISRPYNLLLSLRQRRLWYLGHLLRLPPDSMVGRTLVAMTGAGNRCPEGSLLMDCQGSELKDLKVKGNKNNLALNMCYSKSQYYFPCPQTIKLHTNLKYSKPRLSRTRLSRIFAQLGQNFENG